MPLVGVGILVQVPLEMRLGVHQMALKTGMLQMWGQISEPAEVKKAAGVGKLLIQTDFSQSAPGKIPQILGLKISITTGGHAAVGIQHYGLPELMAGRRGQKGGYPLTFVCGAHFHLGRASAGDPQK